MTACEVFAETGNNPLGGRPGKDVMTALAMAKRASDGGAQRQGQAGAAKTLLKIAKARPAILRELQVG